MLSARLGCGAAGLAHVVVVFARLRSSVGRARLRVAGLAVTVGAGSRRPNVTTLLGCAGACLTVGACAGAEGAEDAGAAGFAAVGANLEVEKSLEREGWV